MISLSSLRFFLLGRFASRLGFAFIRSHFHKLHSLQRCLVRVVYRYKCSLMSVTVSLVFPFARASSSRAHSLRAFTHRRLAWIQCYEFLCCCALDFHAYRWKLGGSAVIGLCSALSLVLISIVKVQAVVQCPRSFLFLVPVSWFVRVQAVVLTTTEATSFVLSLVQ